MRSKANTGPTSSSGELILLFVTAAVLVASLFGPASIQSFLVRSSAIIWTLLLILTVVMLRRKGDQGLLLLAQTLTLLAGIGQSLKDAREVPFGLFGALVWGSVLTASFVFGLLYYAQFVLPLGGNEGWSEGFRLLVRRLTAPPAPAPAASRGSIRSRAKSKLARLEPGREPLPSSLISLRAGLIKSYQVLALTKGSGFSRPAGPGFVMLFKGERIASVIDLRTHVRSQSVKANTRDGIPVETELHVAFRVKETKVDAEDSNLQHPYDKDAIFRVSYASSIGERDEIRLWTERLCPMAADLLTSELAQYTLNELYQGDDSGAAVFDAIKQRIERQLERASSRDGMEVLSIDIGHFELPLRVSEQRIKTWQADWKRKIIMQRAAGDAEVLRRIKNARARSQIEIIENITRNIQAMRQAGDTELTEIIMLRMIEALEDALSDESVKMLVPQQVMTRLMMDSSERLQAWVAPVPEDEQ